MNYDHQVQSGNPHYHHHPVKCVSWTAVVTGALVGIGLSFLLNLFSVAIGLSAFPTTQDGLVTLAVGSFVGMIVGTFVSMFVAGWVAGFLGRPYCYRRNLGVLYGFTAWCVALVFTIFLSAHVGRYVAGYSNFITNPASIVATTNDNVNFATVNTSPSKMVINVDKASTNMAIGAFVVFLLFAVGALGGCFGGHYGMSCKDRTDDNGSCDFCPPDRK